MIHVRYVFILFAGCVGGLSVITFHQAENVVFYIFIYLCFFLLNMSSLLLSSILNLVKKHVHLLDIDHLLGRSVMSLLTLSDLVQYSPVLKAELLALLHVFSLKAPHEITYSNVTVSFYWSVCQLMYLPVAGNTSLTFVPYSFALQDVSDLLSYIHTSLIEHNFR